MTPRKGDNLNGYILLQDFGEEQGGHGRWTFARKNGQEYFVKMYLTHLYPTSASSGVMDETLRKKRIQACEDFCSRHIGIKDLLLAKTEEDGGNLVVTRDFFRNGSHFYKATDRINPVSISVEEVCLFEPDEKLILLRTLADSVRILHSIGIVHGDLKPDNILIQRTPGGKYAAKLIDFDDSFITGQPPENPDDLVGEPLYYSPEMGTYAKRDTVDPSGLTLKSDIFALGLIFHEYITGRLPYFEENYGFPYFACLQGEEHLQVDRHSMPDWAQKLIKSMLQLKWKLRPDIAEVFERLPKPGEWITGPSKSNGDGLKGDLVKKTIKHGLDSLNLKGKGLGIGDN